MLTGSCIFAQRITIYCKFMKDVVLKASELTRTYASGDRLLTVLDRVNFEVRKGESCAITGPSGSGKTTLLGLCAGLDRATSGIVELNGMILHQLNEDERARVRNQFVGFIFQTFNLMPALTALENVMVPIELQREKGARKRAMELLEQVGLADRYHHYPAQLSGGEQQRVSIARAFANQPLILFADEPTGNLDQETGNTIEQLIFDLNRVHQTTLVMVTHDLELAAKTGRVIQMKGGRIIHEYKGPQAAVKL
jgi:putative ABC transport system ATP-binding protein